MAASSSFDVVSRYDKQEMVNAIDQTKREMNTRYDLKDSHSLVELDGDRVTITADGDYRLRTIRDLMESKLVRRGISLKVLRYSEPEQASGGNVRQRVDLVQGIEQDLGRQMVKTIRDEFPKVQAQIQGDSLRVTAKSKDDLQKVIQLLKGKEYPVDLQFVNYR
ncbi:MAG: YajQ family cyclic di-GMP-binding protein [Chloroflexota bacterium]|nr:YajQ family cyclic di-GMP-binding protein [Chloroflexota bacterium]